MRAAFSASSAARRRRVGRRPPGRLQLSEGIEDGELAGGVQERLVLVGSVDVNQPLAEGVEGAQGGGGAVDELAIGPGAGEGALEDELVVLAGLEAVFFEKGPGGL